MFEAVRQHSAYRSVRYSTIRKDIYTPQRSQQRLSIVSVKPAATIQSTFYNSRTIPLKAQTATNFYSINPQRQNYLQTFHSMCESQRKVRDKKEEQINKNNLKVKFQNFDQGFVKDDGTQFTLLDPFHRPHTYLINELKKQQKQLASQRDDMRLIKAQLNALKRNVIASLKSSEDEGLKGIDKIRQLIRKNQIQSQQIRMRVRREITELYQKHDQNVNLEKQLRNRSKGMQRDIFNCEPFELKVEMQENE